MEVDLRRDAIIFVTASKVPSSTIGSMAPGMRMISSSSFRRWLLRLPVQSLAKPSADVDLYVLHYLADVSALTAGSQFFQLLLRFLQGLCMGANEIAILAPSQRKAQKLKISDCRHTHDISLLRIHPEL